MQNYWGQYFYGTPSAHCNFPKFLCDDKILQTSLGTKLIFFIFYLPLLCICTCACACTYTIYTKIFSKCSFSTHYNVRIRNNIQYYDTWLLQVIYCKKCEYKLEYYDLLLFFFRSWLKITLLKNKLMQKFRQHWSMGQRENKFCCYKLQRQI